MPFSLRCDLLEAALPGYTVIDFGLYADIGTAVMLELLELELRSGDLVIIAPEQNALNNNWSADSLWQGLDGRFDLLRRLSPDRLEKLLAAFPGFAGKNSVISYMVPRFPWTFMPDLPSMTTAI